jgi:hypothetical protein
MTKDRVGRALFATVVCVAALAALGVSSAMATPKGEYAVFAQCPLSNEHLAGCLVSKTISGQITIGKQEVPIVKTQTLQGGFVRHRVEGGGESLEFVGAANGETLSKTAQKVPGGLLDLVKCNEITGSGFLEDLARGACELVFENGTTGVNAITELAKPASSIGLNENNLFLESGTALSLPLKVRLENSLLGSECYIGSSSSPVTLNLTTGTTSPKAPNKPIKGKLGETSERAEGGIGVITGNTLVDNTFSAPEASGCGGIFSFLIDPIVDSKLGLPSADGNNTAILNNTVEQATAEIVREYGE